jgi:hypothetical protein
VNEGGKLFRTGTSAEEKWLTGGDSGGRNYGVGFIWEADERLETTEEETALPCVGLTLLHPLFFSSPVFRHMLTTVLRN